MSDPPPPLPPMRKRMLSESEFSELGDLIEKRARKGATDGYTEVTASFNVQRSVPPGFDEAIGRTLRHFARWVAYTKAGTWVAGGIAATFGGLITALIHKLTHFLGP